MSSLSRSRNKLSRKQSRYQFTANQCVLLVVLALGILLLVHYVTKPAFRPQGFDLLDAEVKTDAKGYLLLPNIASSLTFTRKSDPTLPVTPPRTIPTEVTLGNTNDDEYHATDDQGTDLGGDEDGDSGKGETHANEPPYDDDNEAPVFRIAADLPFPISDKSGTRAPTPDECCLFGEQLTAPRVNVTLPNLFFVGTQKGGTTYLSQLMELHPDVYEGECPFREGHNKIKEMHFFDMLHINQTLFETYVNAWGYVDELPQHVEHANKLQKIVKMEASPAYIRHSYIPCRLKMLLPKSKIIILLRDPVDRAKSVYKMNYGLSKTNSTFMELIQDEYDWLKDNNCLFQGGPGIEPKTWRDCFKCDYQAKKATCFGQLPTSTEGQQFTPLGTILRGMYAPMLAWWLEYFPVDQVLIMNSQDIKDDEIASVNRVLRFAGISADFQKKWKYNPNGALKKSIDLQWPPGFRELTQEQVDGDLKEGGQFLEQFFQPLNQQLVVLLQELGIEDFTPFRSYVESK